MHTQLPWVDPRNGDDLDSRFEVARIICIGRNYAAHAREMGHQNDASTPMFFFKPLTALNLSGYFTRPGFSDEVHHEVELVVAITQAGQALTPDTATACVGGFGVGLDMTCRDLQQEAKSQGQPWDLAKGFDGSAVCSPLARCQFSHLSKLGELTLTNNEQVVQVGHWRDMLWPIPELLSRISQYVALVPGDLIFTGTPAGVAPVTAGDRLRAEMEGLPFVLEVTVV